jgi:hypothetical protein
MAKGSRSLNLPREPDPEETVYGPEDYATADAIDRLRALGEYGSVHEIEEQFGELDPMGLDPMRILMALEEDEGG